MTPDRSASLKGIATIQARRRRQRDAQRAADHAERVASESPAEVLARRDRYRTPPQTEEQKPVVEVPVHGRDPSAWLWQGKDL